MSDAFHSAKSSHVYERFTICEMHRQLYDLLVLSPDFEHKKKMLELLEKAYLMGIKLIDKLAEYKLEYKFISPSDGDTPDIEEVVNLRQLRVNLERKMADANGNRLRPSKQ